MYIYIHDTCMKCERERGREREREEERERECVLTIWVVVSSRELLPPARRQRSRVQIERLRFRVSRKMKSVSMKKRSVSMKKRSVSMEKKRVSMKKRSVAREKRSVSKKMRSMYHLGGGVLARILAPLEERTLKVRAFLSRKRHRALPIPDVEERREERGEGRGERGERRKERGERREDRGERREERGENAQGLRVHDPQAPQGTPRSFGRCHLQRFISKHL